MVREQGFGDDLRGFDLHPVLCLGVALPNFAGDFTLCLPELDAGLWSGHVGGASKMPRPVSASLFPPKRFLA